MKVGDEVWLNPKMVQKLNTNDFILKGVIKKIDGKLYFVSWGNGLFCSCLEEELILINKNEQKGHPNASILMEIAKEAAINPEYWSEFEFEDDHIGWTGAQGQGELFRVVIGTDYQVRRKPRTIRIGNYDVPEPSEVSIKHFDISTTVMIEFEKGEDAKPMLKALQELIGAKQ